MEWRQVVHEVFVRVVKLGTTLAGALLGALLGGRRQPLLLVLRVVSEADVLVECLHPRFAVLPLVPEAGALLRVLARRRAVRLAADGGGEWPSGREGRGAQE